ncbi:hypothetical protein [Ferruginibacter sp.]|nr:hypothetical protein [Ferruginibacter sp.]
MSQVFRFNSQRTSLRWYPEAHRNAVVGMQGWVKCVSVPTTQRTATKNKTSYTLCSNVVGTPPLIILASIPTTAFAVSIVAASYAGSIPLQSIRTASINTTYCHKNQTRITALNQLHPLHQCCWYAITHYPCFDTNNGICCFNSGSQLYRKYSTSIHTYRK